MKTMPVEAIDPPPTPANVAPHLPPPTEIPFPGPSAPVQLAQKPSHGVSGELSEEKELEAMVGEISAALASLGVDGGEGNPQSATEPVTEPAGNRQLKLEDMKAAVWLPRLPKKQELGGTPNVAALDNNGVLRPVANPHSKPAAPPIRHEPSEDLGSPSEDWGQRGNGFPKMGLLPIIQNREYLHSSKIELYYI